MKLIFFFKKVNTLLVVVPDITPAFIKSSEAIVYKNIEFDELL
jgi:hypothetical protein